MNKKKVTFSIVLFVFILILVFIKYGDTKLTRKSVLLSAKTVGWGTSSYMGLNLDYEFYYDGKRITGSDAFNDFRGNKDFVNRNFPVMYEPSLGSSKLLIEPSDFRRFELSFPDS